MATFRSFVGRWWMPGCLAVMTCAAGISIAKTPRLRELEFEIQQRLQLAITPADLSDKISIIEVSAEDNRMLTGADLQTIPRSYHARLIDDLKRAGAKVVIFDLLFARPDTENGSKRDRAKAVAAAHLLDLQNDVFASAVKRSAPLGVVFCQFPNNDRDARERNGYRYHFERPYFLPKNLPSNVAFGQAEPVETGTLYGEMALVCRDATTGHEIPSLALLGFCLSHGIQQRDITPRWTNHDLQVDTTTFYMDSKGGMPIDWPQAGHDFESIPYSKALSLLAEPNANQQFGGKIVLVGNEDDRLVATVHGEKLGTWVLAAQLNTMLRRDQGTPKPVPAGFNVVWQFSLAMIIASALSSKRRRAAAVIAVAALATSFAMPFLVFIAGHWSMDITTSLAVALVATMASLLMRIGAPGYIASSPIRTFEATVLFADLRNSTPIVRSLGPRAGGEVLDLALKRARWHAESEGGRVIRTQGDGLVAVFAAASSGDHAARAIAAAQRITEIGAVGGQAGGMSAFRCGIESGSLHGSDDAVQGLTLHLAARLEALCVVVGRGLLVGPTAFGLAMHSVSLIELGDYELKGIEGRVRVYGVAENRDPESGD